MEKVTQDIVQAHIGVDVGGTHTDAAVVWGDRTARGKAFTTYDDFSVGVIRAVDVAAGSLGVSSAELLSQTALFVNGTTVVTNTITELRGTKVGVLVTRGFKDTFRFAGGPRRADFDDHLQVNVPDLVDRRAIREIDERIDYAGTVRVSLDLGQVELEARRLVEEYEVEGIAVCFMSSHVNADHERQVGQRLAELFPSLFVSLSHEVLPVIGENRRWTTTVLNCFVQRNAKIYLDSVSERLRAAGLAGGMAFFQGLGGGISRARAERMPLALLGSGPAGGAIGANVLARKMGRRHVLVGDMGGTSFDTGIIRDNDVKVNRNIAIGPFATGVTLLDVISVGAGGGSVAWVSERGAPLVGPRSAGSTPGPAAYGNGGTEPTVTDAMIAMGFIDPDNYLAGRAEIRRDLAEQALVERFGRRFGWNADEAGAAVHDLVVANMANAVRAVSVNRGFDPRDFLFLAYGGTLPLFAAQIADNLSIGEVVVPRNSSVYCAQGLTASDFILRFDQSVTWDLATGAGLEQVNEVARRLQETAISAMRDEGFSDDEITLERQGEFRFLGQVFDLTMALPDRELRPEDQEPLARAFFDLYEQTYGVGTAWQGVPEQLQSYVVTVTGHRSHPEPGGEELSPTPPAGMLKATRSVYLPSSRGRHELPVYDDARFTPGSAADGPAIIDAADTTIFVPSDRVVRRDEFMNYVITHKEHAS